MTSTVVHLLRSMHDVCILYMVSLVCAVWILFMDDVFPCCWMLHQQHNIHTLVSKVDGMVTDKL